LPSPHAGPFAVVSTPVGKAAPGEQASEKRPSAEAGAATPALLTHFGPPARRAELEHTVKFVPLVFAFYETFLGSKFPYGSLQQVGGRPSKR
jgi:hypothetical protein